MYFPTLLTVLVCVLTHQSMEYSTNQDRWENLLFQVLTTRDHSRVSWCSGKNSGSWQSQSTGNKLGVCLRVMHRKEEEEKNTALTIHLYKHESFEQLLKWRTTKTNGCHHAASLWRWGKKEKEQKSNALSRGLFEIVGEYFASSSLPSYGWHQENMIHSSYFVAACNPGVGVFARCLIVMLPSSATSQSSESLHSLFGQGNNNMEPKKH